MRAGRSIRVRLTMWYSAVLLLGLALFGGGLWFALEHKLIAGVDQRLAERAQGVRTVIEIEGQADRRELEIELAEFVKELRDGTVIGVRDANGDLVPAPAPPPAPPRYRVLHQRVEYGGRTYQVLAAAPLDDVRAVMRTLRNLLLVMIPGVLALACLGGYWISRRALAPVDEITRVARSITLQNLSKRLVVPNTGDELQRMSETWNEVLERLESAVKRIRQFTADASHELRTPVALIRATAELALRRERDTGQYRKSLREIASEAERMSELTDSLLTLARADANGAGMPLSAANLSAVVAEVVERNEPVAEAKGIALRAELPETAAVARANEPGIRRLLLILVDNALKHTPPGGTVTVSAQACGGGIRLAVRDSGEGIEAAALPHIFERFYRADPARGGEGAGLGLSIAQAIAEAHGARIEVESAPGQGACFHLVLSSPGR